ncbi:helix-turn-helix transcriptional regulator [Curtobacterium flaccumfaciens pv. oortii]|uniref:helix-turn-helix transcriptional regulator n=1 Tax=Curtobacterium flaccumfaciens TaxID=2035 RepID=UPI002657FBE6|nr:helix-turn-helix transcriptional regulator [Curtobacterium flaccumfaciens]MCS5524673.1 helix-turn-helix transcriptional regulator [Curtobacterium flaccumfaciens pv. oortii]
MSDEHVRQGLEEFIPHSPDFRRVVQHPHELLDWTRVPSFRETAIAREILLAAGFQQGVSFLLVDGARAVGTMHLNMAHTAHFSDQELTALDKCRHDVQRHVAGFVHAGELGVSRRELEVLRLLVEGGSNRQIAERLAISVSTVNRHVESILVKLGASNRVQAAVTGLLLGLVETNDDWASGNML